MPDDYTASTSTTGAVTVGGSATGNIEASRDVDWFAVALVAGRTYVIDMEGADAGGGTLGDTKLLGVFDDQGNRVAGKSDGGGKGGDAQLVFTAAESGTFYIAARGGGRDDTGTYTVRVRDRDPDGLAAGATDLGDLGGMRLVRQDSVDGGADAADYWRFTLSETQAVTLGLRRQDANADLYLEDADGNVLHASTSGGTQAEEIAATLEAGTYYVRVAAQEAGDNDYWLRARAEDPAPAQPAAQQPSEPPAQPEPAPQLPAQPAAQQQQRTISTSVSEPNGGDLPRDTSTAGQIVVGGSATGEIAAGDDRDWFAVTLEAGKVYRFDVKGKDTGDGTLPDPYMTIYDENGALYLQGGLDDAGVGMNSSAIVRPAKSGTYYLEADGYGDGTDTGTYTVSVTEFTDDYAAGTDTTGKVAVGGTATGEIEHPYDHDAFKVELKAGKHYRFDLKGSATGDGTLNEPELRLYDSEGAPIQDGGIPWYDFASGVGNNARGYFTPAEDGTYLVTASGWIYDSGTYTLSVQEVESVPETVEGDDVASDTTTTGRIAVGETVRGNIQSREDVDWFAVTLEAGKTYEVSRSGRDQIYPSGTSPAKKGTLPNSEITGAIYDDEGVLIRGTVFTRTFKQLDGTLHWPGNGLNKDWMRFTPDEDGTYYVSMGSHAGYTGGAIAQGTYTLSLEEVDAM